MSSKADSNAVVSIITFYSHALAEAEARAENAEQMLAEALKQQQARARARTPAWREDLVRVALEVVDAAHTTSPPFDMTILPLPLHDRLGALVRCAGVYRERQAGAGTAVPEPAPVDGVEPPEHPAR